MPTIQDSSSVALTSAKGSHEIHVKGIEVKFVNSQKRKRDILIHMTIGDGKPYVSNPFTVKDDIIWDVEHKFPSTLMFKMIIREQHTVRRDKVIFNVCVPADEMIVRPLIIIEKGDIVVNIRCETPGPVSLVELVCELVEESQNRLADMKVFLDELSAVCERLNFVIGIIDPFAEAHPAVKVVVEVVKTLYEAYKKRSECNEAAIGLMRDIKSFLPFTRIRVERLKSDITEQAVSSLLETFAKIANSIIRYSSDTTLGNVLDDHTDEVNDFKEEFKRLKETFDWCVKTEIWRTVLEIENDTRSMHLDKLRSVPQSFYDTKKSCFEGTREETLQTLQRWSTSESDLFWLHGAEGSGKTAIAHTMAQLFDNQNRLAGCFFFNRDDPACRNPVNIIPTIAYQLAKLHEDYCNVVLGILRGPDERNIHTSLNQQFRLLLDRPLTMLSRRTHSDRLPPVHRPMVIVLDSPELCYDSDSEIEWRRLVGYLRDIGTIVPQLKICISSRKQPEIDVLSDTTVQHLDISDPFTDLRLDILTLLRHCGKKEPPITARHNDLEYKRNCLYSRIQIALRRADIWIGSHYTNTRPQKTPDELFYVATWKDIAAQSGDTKAFRDSVAGMLCSAKILVWIDTLFLVGALGMGKDVLSDCAEYFKEDELINRAAKELLNFVADFEPAIALGISHIYASTLVWLPMDSPVRRGIGPRAPKIAFEIFQQPASDVVTIDSDRHIICSTARSPDGSRIVSGSTDGTLEFWDGVTGARIGEEIKGHTDRVHDVRYSPDGTKFVSGSRDKTVKIWDVTGKPVTEMDSDSDVWAVVFSEDGRRVVSGHGNGMLRIWDAQNGRLIAGSQKHEHFVVAIAYSLDGRKIISGSWDKSIRIWDAQTGNQIGEPLKGHEEWVNSVAYSPDGSKVVSGSYDAAIRIWDAHTGTHIGEPLSGRGKAVVDVDYSQDGSRIISASEDDTIQFWNATNGDPVAVLRRGECCWDPEGQYFVSIPSWWPASSWLKSFSTQSLVYSSNPLYVPDDGWIRTLDGGLLLWVPPQHRRCSCHAARESTITVNDRDEQLRTSAWKDIPQETNWTKIMNTESN